MTILADVVDHVIGVDTHAATNTAAILTVAGEHVATTTETTDGDGYAALVELADEHCGLRAWSIEGTNSYGAGLARYLTTRGEVVIEIERPNRPARRRGDKTDEIDAIAAAREALAGDIDKLAEPRDGSERAALAALLVARRSAVDTATVAKQQLNGELVKAPAEIRDRYRGYKTPRLVTECAKIRRRTTGDIHTRTVADVLRRLAKRAQRADREVAELDAEITAIVKSWRPDLLAETGVGPFVAATILCAWSHPGRFRNEGSFAMLAGTAPIPASSGKTTRYRLNRYGDRQLNRAIHTICITRLRHDPNTRAYTERRTTEGRTKPEIRRCLKRYISRRLYRLLEHPPITT